LVPQLAQNLMPAGAPLPANRRPQSKQNCDLGARLEPHWEQKLMTGMNQFTMISKMVSARDTNWDYVPMSLAVPASDGGPELDFGDITPGELCTTVVAGAWLTSA